MTLRCDLEVEPEGFADGGMWGWGAGSPQVWGWSKWANLLSYRRWDMEGLGLGDQSRDEIKNLISNMET